MSLLRQSTATAVLIGPFLDDQDGKTPETGLDVTSMDADLYKHSNTHPLTKGDLSLTASGGSNDCAHVANGYYSLELTSGNTDTAGRLILSINISGALPVWHSLVVVPQQVFDSVVLDTDELQVHTTEISDSAIAAATIASAACNKIADHTIRRSFQNACDSTDGDSKTFRSLLGAIAKLVNKLGVSGSTLTVYEDDDTTTLGTQTVTTSGSAEPITSLDTD